MRLLLDTHIFLWAVSAVQRLSNEARQLISDGENEVFVSVVSLWEIAIKRASGRISAPMMSAAEAIDWGNQAGYGWIPVRPEHAVAVEGLPLLHGDPFDRLLVAQALSEPMRLLTQDRHLAAYSDMVLLV